MARRGEVGKGEEGRTGAATAAPVLLQPRCLGAYSKAVSRERERGATRCILPHCTAHDKALETRASDATAECAALSS